MAANIAACGRATFSLRRTGSSYREVLGWAGWLSGPIAGAVSSCCTTKKTAMMMMMMVMMNELGKAIGGRQFSCARDPADLH